MTGYQIVIETRTRVITINLPARKARKRRPATTAVAEVAPVSGSNSLPGWLVGRRSEGRPRFPARG